MCWWFVRLGKRMQAPGLHAMLATKGECVLLKAFVVDVLPDLKKGIGQRSGVAVGDAELAAIRASATFKKPVLVALFKPAAP